MSLRDPDDFVGRGILDLVGPEMLPDRVLVFEEPLREGFIDHRYLPRRLRVLLRNGPAQHDLRA